MEEEQRKLLRQEIERQYELVIITFFNFYNFACYLGKEIERIFGHQTEK